MGSAVVCQSPIRGLHSTYRMPSARPPSAAMQVPGTVLPVSTVFCGLQVQTCRMLTPGSLPASRGYSYRRFRQDSPAGALGGSRHERRSTRRPCPAKTCGAGRPACRSTLWLRRTKRLRLWGPDGNAAFPRSTSTPSSSARAIGSRQSTSLPPAPMAPTHSLPANRYLDREVRNRSLGLAG